MSEQAAAPARQTAAPERSSKGELMLQRKCACGQHTMAGGECAGCRNKRLKLQRWSADRPVRPAMLQAHASMAPAMMRRDPGSGVDLTSARTHTPTLVATAEGLAPEAPVGVAPSPETAPAPGAESPEAAPAAEGTPEASPKESPSRQPGPALIVEDSATDLASGQLRKSDFLDQLHAIVHSEAEAVLAGTEHSTDGCPYLSFWFDFYRSQSSKHIQRALHHYVPQARGARSASEYIPLVAMHVRLAVEHWLRTGEVTGVPEGGPEPAAAQAAAARTETAPTPVQLKSRDGGGSRRDDPAVVRSELGPGRPLESSVRSRMESAFGKSFACVRTHTDATASRLSSEQNARAFTVGEHVGFGAGEYAPGTIVGDALLAHELAHVVQQAGAVSTAGPLHIGGSAYDGLEGDADTAAGAAVASIWGRTRETLKDISENAMPRLKSGLRLSRCPSSPRGAVKDPSGGSRRAACVTVSSIRARKTGSILMSTTVPGFACALAFGEPPDASGIEVESVVDIPHGCRGRLEYVQLVDTCRQLSLGGRDFRRKSSGFILDKRDPWRSQEVDSNGDSTFFAKDSPAQPVVDKLTFVAADDKFRAWLLWRPAGERTRVPLAVTEWYWRAKATKAGSSGACKDDWTISDPRAEGGTGAATTEMPTWTDDTESLNKRRPEEGTCD